MRILSYRLPELQAQIDKFNKKATKWGLPLVSYEVASKEVVERLHITMSDGEEVQEKFKVEESEVVITGEIPRIAGWSIHSKIQPSEVQGQNFVFTVQGHEEIPSLRTRPMFCDHCKTRRLKLTAYLIENEETKQQMMVGATCLGDFLPNIDIERLLSYLNSFNLIGGMTEDRVPREHRLCELKRAIMDAYVSIKKRGFISRAKAEEMNWEKYPTAGDIDVSGKERQDLYKDVDVEAVEKAIEGFIPFINSKSSDGDDFIYNVQLSVAAEWVRPKLYGYLAAAVNMWLREAEQVVRESRPRLNEHFGNIATRYELKGMKVARVNAVEGYYGTTYIYSFADEQGRDFTWFASSKQDLEVDDVVDLQGSVKQHDEYKGRLQTVLTRCKIIKWHD